MPSIVTLLLPLLLITAVAYAEDWEEVELEESADPESHYSPVLEKLNHRVKRLPFFGSKCPEKCEECPEKRAYWHGKYCNGPVVKDDKCDSCNKKKSCSFPVSCKNTVCGVKNGDPTRKCRNGCKGYTCRKSGKPCPHAKCRNWKCFCGARAE